MDNDGSLTMEEFLSAYNRMAEIVKRQDSLEQKKRLHCLIFFGPKIQRQKDSSALKLIDLCKKIFSLGLGVSVENDDIAHLELKTVCSESNFSKSLFIKFHSLDMRY